MGWEGIGKSQVALVSKTEQAHPVLGPEKPHFQPGVLLGMTGEPTVPSSFLLSSFGLVFHQEKFWMGA